MAISITKNLVFTSIYCDGLWKLHLEFLFDHPLILFFFLIPLLSFRRPGGDRIYGVFDNQLPAALRKLPFDRHLSPQNVRKVVSEADGYQPHLIAPEQGYRRLIDSALNYFRGPAEASVDAVSALGFILLCDLTP